VFNGTCQHVYKQFYENLKGDDRLLSPQALDRYCTVVKRKGEPSGRIWGFIDGTHREICRPRFESAKQEDFYSGFKRFHSMHYLAIVTPDGLLACVRGPYEGKMSDWGMYKDDMDEMLHQKAFDSDGERVYVFGDKGFYLEECVIGAFRAAAGSELSEEEEIFNAYMAKERMAVEWGFEKVTSLFGFNRLPVSFKYGLSPIATYYITSVLLTNCHTCYNSGCQ
jgi:hypothetical protein